MGLLKKKEKYSRGKASGSYNLYFILHNIVSLPTFFFVAIVFHLTDHIPTTLDELFSLKFLGFFGIVLFLNYLVGLFSRVFAYALINIYYSWEDPRIAKYKKEVPPLSEMLNDGTLGFFTRPYLMLMLLSTIAFTLSVASIIQNKIFKDDSLLAVILSYIIIKIIIGAYIYFKYK
jgi:hypothetical protein